LARSSDVCCAWRANPSGSDGSGTGTIIPPLRSANVPRVRCAGSGRRAARAGRRAFSPRRDGRNVLRMEPILFAGRLVASSARETLRAVDPATGEELDERFPVSPREELGALAAAGKRAAAVMREVPAERIAEFLERCAAEIEADADALAARAARETGLPLRPRLREVEIGRTLDQLRQAAACVRTGAWALPDLGRERDLASAYTALGGPVFVIGPSNFPFAYNALGGGDFASALAAGNPVIANANPGHPGTTGMLAQCIARAIEQCPTLPPAVVQMFYH